MTLPGVMLRIEISRSVGLPVQIDSAGLALSTGQRMHGGHP